MSAMELEVGGGSMVYRNRKIMAHGEMYGNNLKTLVARTDSVIVNFDVLRGVLVAGKIRSKFPFYCHGGCWYLGDVTVIHPMTPKTTERVVRHGKRTYFLARSSGIPVVFTGGQVRVVVVSMISFSWDQEFTCGTF